MDIYDSYLSHLSVACNELLSRIQNQSYALDTYFLQSAIDHIFNDSQIDLLSVLPQSGINDSEDEYSQVVELIGTNSISVLESNTGIFEYFITSFCRHLERSSCTFPLKVVEDSVYMKLLADYVCFMMPVNDENPAIVTTKKIHPESTMRSSYSTPLNLLKETRLLQEALRRYALCPSSHSIRTLRTMTQSISPHFLTFICILVRSYCSLFVLKEIHVFVLAESEDFNFSQSKLQLQWNAPFADELFDFFLSLFTRWPPNPSFTNLFDVWVTWIRPWRYCGNDLQRVMPFILSNRRYYIELSDAFWRRKFSLSHTQDVENLTSYICILTSPDMLEVYEALEYNLEQNIFNLMNFLEESVDNLSLKMLKGEEKLGKASWFQRTFFCVEEELLLTEQKRTLEALEKLIMNAGKAVLDGDRHESQNFTFAPGTNRITTLTCNECRTNTENNSLSSFLPPSRKQVPDYYVDSATKLMYLTPLGRKQVARGTHRFDYSKCSKATPPIIASLRSGEVWWLSRLLYRISRAVNRTRFIQYLSQSYEDSTVTGFIARVVLDPEYPNVTVPAHSAIVAFQKPCLNLRYFACYRNLIPVSVGLLMDEFLDESSLDRLRAVHESDEQWKLRRMFIERHMADYPKNRLLCLAQIFCNMISLGCTYNQELMKTVKEMGSGLCEAPKGSKRTFERENVKMPAPKKSKFDLKSGTGISEDSPCALKRKSFMLIRAQLTVLEKGTEPLISLNQLTSRLKYKWELKNLENGKSALLVNDVTVLEGILPAWNDNDAKNFAAAAALASLSREDREVRAKGGKFESWKGNCGPANFYTSYVVDQLKLAVKVMPTNGTAFDKLESGLRIVRMPLRYVTERGTGWEQKISINALNVQLASAVLRKGECTKSREKERKEDLAALVIQRLSEFDFELIPSNSGYILS
uniref:XRN2-binding (XTBD) domain-containing protein n=1 Tax=Setaria digitata TaxID=48799 RepID=A0A915Q222_9BILA